MKLRELGAVFIAYRPRPDSWIERVDGVDREVLGMRDTLAIVDALAEADGVQFLCPKCFAANGGSVGTHSVICWFVGKVPDALSPKPGRWRPSPESTGLDDLTFCGPGAYSVQLIGGCGWHGFVAGGKATLQ